MNNILVISGQLGTGKTTRLNLILRQVAERQLTAFCVVNDVGDKNVDALRVRSVGEVLPLTTGCICCESIGALKKVLKEAAQKPKLDLLIVEPTGIADATTIRRVAEEIGFDWHCLCLIDVQHFALNEAIGMDQFQLPAATAIGLTWAEDITDLQDEQLVPILTSIGHHSSAPIQILAEDKSPLLEDLLKRTEVRVCGCGHKHDNDHHHNHDHHDHHHHGDHDHNHHHQHVYVTSVEFADGIDESVLLPVLVKLFKENGLVRGKGVCERIGDDAGRYEWDFVQGSIVWGGKSGGTPGGNFISSKGDLRPYLNFMCKYCDDNKKAVAQMDVFTDSDLPVEKTIEAIEYLLAQYPSPVTREGRVLTNCDADPAKHLARRSGVSREVHERAYRKSVAWRIEGFRYLVSQWKTKNWPEDYAFYRACFILGKALINTLQIDWVNDLMSVEIRQDINSLPTTELTLLGWEWMEVNKPEEIAENLKPESVYRVLRYGMEHGLEPERATAVFDRARRLFESYRPDYEENDWAQKL